ncbi:MAG: AAA family ATPase [Candidatus Omnitrophica bacterium]|nr:AAA family ATPase [Candidatus Omnitrophota bacterium]
MYEKYWGLKEKPFENTPDPSYMFYTKKHEEALTRMLYAARENKGAAMLTGDYGSGKTVLSRIFIDELMKNKSFEIALITHPQLTPEQFIQEIIYQLKTEHKTGDKLEILHLMQNIVYDNYNQGRRTVIVIDEAQIIRNEETFEELRLLLNFQLNKVFLLTLILIGQPELLTKINAIPQLQQRLGIKYHLTGLDRIETEDYVKHRLSVAGAVRDIFTKESCDLVFEYSGGIPRKINNVCDMGLLIAYGQEEKVIDKDLMEKVVKDLKSGVTVDAEDV